MSEQKYIIEFYEKQQCDDFMYKYEEISAKYLWLDDVARDYHLNVNAAKFDLISTNDLDLIALLLANNILEVSNYAAGASLNDVKQITEYSVVVTVDQFSVVDSFFTMLASNSDKVKSAGRYSLKDASHSTDCNTTK